MFQAILSANLHNLELSCSKLEFQKRALILESPKLPNTSSIPELCHVQSLNVSYCWNFTLFSLFCDTLNDDSCFVIWGGSGGNAKLLFLAALEVGMSFVEETKKSG